VERNVRGRDLPWLNNAIKKAIHERDYCFRKAKQPGGENLWSTYKRKRNRVTCMIRQKKARYYKSLIQESQSTPQKLWKAIKKCLSNKKPCEQKPKSLRINSTITSDNREIANGFNKFFTNVSATLRATLPRVYEATSAKSSGNGNDISPKDIKFVFRPARKGEVLKVVSSLKRSKSPGLDNIPPEL